MDDVLEKLKLDYDLIDSYVLGRGQKHYIGVKGKECRFCNKSSPNVSFKSLAHAVPEFLGNHQLIIHNECDSCNTFFSEHLENHLDKYTKPYRSVGQIKGKKKIPKYKSKDHKSRFSIDNESGITISASTENDFAEIDLDNNKIKLDFHREPYIPSAVYKCLVKIALSVISEEELKTFSHALNWIQNKDHSKLVMTPLSLLVTRVPGPQPFPKMIVKVLRKKPSADNCPYCILVLCFANIVYQIVIPSDGEIESKKLNIVINFYPIKIASKPIFGNIFRNVESLTNSSIVEDDKISIEYKFDQAIEIAKTK